MVPTRRPTDPIGFYQSTNVKCMNTDLVYFYSISARARTPLSPTIAAPLLSLVVVGRTNAETMIAAVVETSSSETAIFAFRGAQL